MTSTIHRSRTLLRQLERQRRWLQRAAVGLLLIDGGLALLAMGWASFPAW